MKKFSSFFFFMIAAWTVSSVHAQNYEALNHYMAKYGQGWSTSYNEQTGNGEWTKEEQVGHILPEFRLNKQLNSRSLRGRFVVLNFWATWCGGCRLLSCDIDSLMKLRPTAWEGVQVIGVDAHETLVDKGYKAEEWWKSKGIGFPTVGGKLADACADVSHGHHPTVLVVDGHGIVRGRWDGWNPTTALNIELALWALKTVPEQNIRADRPTVETLMQQKEYRKALYLMEMIPDAPDNSALRYECMLRSGEERYAAEYFETLRAKYADRQDDRRPAKAYVEIMQPIAECVYASGTTNLDILRNGIDAFRTLSSAGLGHVALYEKAAELRMKYAEAYKKTAVSMLKTALQYVDRIENEQQKAAETARLKKLIEQYR